MGSLFVRIEKAATLPGEPESWIVLFNGVQQGGVYDTSGAGTRTFISEDEARSWAVAVLYDIEFQWEM